MGGKGSGRGKGKDLENDLGGGLLRFGQRPDRSGQRGREEKKDRFAGLRRDQIDLEEKKGIRVFW